jgi:hypothetical protein
MGKCMIIAMNFNVHQTLVLVYLISLVASFYVMIMNDIVNKKTTGESLFACMVLSLPPVLNTVLLVFYGVSNILDASKWNK